MTKDERDQLIIRYFKDEMSPSEREQFEEEVQANSELKEEVDLFRNLNLAFFEIEKEKFKNHHLKALKYSLQAGNSFRSGFKVVFSIIAASLLLIAVTWSLFISKDIDKEDIYFAHFEPYPNVEYPITRGSNDLKMEAFSRYEMQDYKNAIHLFEKLSELQSERLHSYYFYSGISYMGLSDFKTALLKFEWV
ncbi:MAG: hypothetical protein JJU23_12415, partial [Cyclobacteriaceae bacterium]|nr:hypothetical protein [Cyclobacteriaceae bacterium]